MSVGISTENVNNRVPRETLRVSESRRKKLERGSQRRTKNWGLTLRIDPDHDTAHVSYESKPYQIVITGREIEQNLTDLPGRVWDKTSQKVLTLHENAHILHTDFEHFQSIIEEKDEKTTYQRLHNVFEDGRIESLIRVDYPIFDTDFAIFNANLSAEGLRMSDWETIEDESEITDLPSQFQNQDSTETRTLSIGQAIQIGGLDKGVHDSKRYEKLIDPDCSTYQFLSDNKREVFMSKIHPRLISLCEDLKTERDAKRANEKIIAFIDLIIEYIPSYDTVRFQAGMKNGGMGGKPDDSGRKKGKPQDTTEPPENADSPAETTDLSDIDLDQYAESVQDEIDSENVTESTENKTADSDKDQKAAQNSDRFKNNKIEQVSKNTCENSDIWSKAKQRANNIANVIDIKDIATEINTNQQNGAIQNSAVVRAYIGDTRKYKMQKKIVDSPLFNIFILLDRSSSMKETERKTAIEASLQILHVFNEYQTVNVGVYELFDDEIRLVKPLENDVRRNKNELTHDSTRGKTPLTDGLSFVKERIELESKKAENRIFVITDGRPTNPTEYQAELSQTTVPVYGLSISNGDPTGKNNYHRHRTVKKNGANLTNMMKGLLREISQSNQR